MNSPSSSDEDPQQASVPLVGPLSSELAAKLASSMGLLPQEYLAITDRLQRQPSHCELAIFAGMWSEHCSYKSTRHLLAQLPKEGARVLAGPGSHAGVVDVGEGWAVAFKIESHNHPSAVEPYQGAATGVGGILRDIIAQGARPCAIMDFLCFGDPDSADTQRIAHGVIAGIGGYGNAVGVPNVGGRTQFDPAYEGNPLVNALAAGLVRPDEQRHARASREGSLLLLVGAATGRDGVLGAAFASEALGDASSHAKRRSHIQIGDPFSGKLLQEAILSFGPAQGLLATQDLGACGIACASFEMAALGAVGLDLWLDEVPLREPDLTPLEVLLSETQERFAIVIDEAFRERAVMHFQQAGLTAAVIGAVQQTGHVRIYSRGECIADLPAQLVAGGAPRSEWTAAAALPAQTARAASTFDNKSPIEVLLSLLTQCSDAEPIYSQYDQTVGNKTICGPGQAAAAVIRLPDSKRGFALTLCGRGDLCASDPFLGAQSAVAEVLRRMGCVGAELVAVTDGLNFASPRDPVQYLRIERVISGIASALRTLGVPVTGGNVSLYNESPHGAIPPTPMIGGLGIAADVRLCPRSVAQQGQHLYVLGTLRDHPCASLYSQPSEAASVVPDVDLDAERRLYHLLHSAIAERLLSATKPVSRGGLLTTLARLCIRSQCGAELTLPSHHRTRWLLFGEYAAQVIVSVDSPQQAERLSVLAEQQQIALTPLGIMTGTTLHLAQVLSVDVRELLAASRLRSAQRDAESAVRS
ncbi:MAG: phosphoribosylformylglycinamidine synthase subunit PurL [Polyangia bacterium]